MRELNEMKSRNTTLPKNVNLERVNLGDSNISSINTDVINKQIQVNKSK